MIKPNVLVGECSIHVLVRGVLLMTIPHRMWESRFDEGGEVRWSGESRGEATTVSLVRYLQEKIHGCEDRRDLFTRLQEILKELRSPVWGKSFREEEIERTKKKEGERKKGQKSETATLERTFRREVRGDQEAAEEFEWSRAA
jgi:hypothetical protein